MAWYRRSKLGFDAISFHFTSKTTACKNPIPNPASVIYRNNQLSKFTSSANYPLRVSKFSLFSPVSVDRSSNIRLYARGYRYYYGGRYRYSDKRWFDDRMNVLIVVSVGSGIGVTVYFWNVETIPYTKRRHLILLSKNLEKTIGEFRFNHMKAWFEGKILQETHPESVRVRLITKEIIEALQRGLKKEKGWSDLIYTSESGAASDNRGNKTSMAITEETSGGDNLPAKDDVLDDMWVDQNRKKAKDKGEESATGHLEGLNYASESRPASDNRGNETLMAMTEENWPAKDEVLDHMWVDQNRKNAKDKAEESATGHLEGLNWEVLVVNDHVVNAFCFPGGKIVVFTGLLKHFKTDEEIATIIGHVVAHAVARHSAEKITKNLWFTIVQIILSKFFEPRLVDTMSKFLLRRPFSRRMEIEADYIGLLLMASAGYDPRVAPKVFDKLGQVSGDSALRDYLSTHPSGKKRSKLLSEANVMQEAVAIYREVVAGREVDGFFL